MTSPEQNESAGGLLPALLAVYGTYLTYRAANGSISTSWQEVSEKLQLPLFLGDKLAMIAARALAQQRAGLGAGADELWLAVPQSVQAGIDAGLQTVAEALIWTDSHEEQDTKDEAGGLVPTQASPPVELALVTTQAVSAAAQQTAAEAAGWRYKTWKTVLDRQVRESHRHLHNVKVSLQESFVDGDGNRMRYPGDPLAPIDTRIGCRCWLTTSR